MLLSQLGTLTCFSLRQQLKLFQRPILHKHTYTHTHTYTFVLLFVLLLLLFHLSIVGFVGCFCHLCLCTKLGLVSQPTTLLFITLVLCLLCCVAYAIVVAVAIIIKIQTNAVKALETKELYNSF